MVDTSSPLDNEPPDGVASDLRAEGEQLLADAAAGYEAGDFDSCRRFAEGAEAIFVRLGDDQRALAARQRQAMAWAVQGDLGRAVQLNTTLIEAYTELGDTMSAAKCLTNLGVNLQMLGRRAAAIDAFTTARRAFARHGDRVFELAMTHMNLGALQRLEGRAGLGLAHSRRAAQLFGGLAHGGSRVVDCLRHVSLALDDLGRPEEAEDVRTRAERLARDAGDIVRAAAVRRSRGGALAKRGNHAAALDEQRAALTEMLAGRDANIHAVQESLRNIARLYALTGDPGAAWPFAVLATVLIGRTLEGLQSTSQRDDWRRRQRVATELACSLACRLSRWDDLAILVEQMRSQQPLAIGVDPAHHDAGLPLGPMPRIEVGSVAIDTEDLIGRVLADLDAAQAHVRGDGTLLRRLTSRDTALTIDLEHLRSTLAGERGLLWGSLTLDETSFWYVVDSAAGVTGGSVAVGPASDVGPAIDEVRSIIPTSEVSDRDKHDRLQRGAAVLDGPAGVVLGRSLLPAPLRARLAVSDRRDSVRVVVIPSPDLAALPIAALPVEGAGRPLALLAEVVLCPSPSLAVQRLHDRRRPGDGPRRPVELVVADPSGDLRGARRLARLAPVRLIGRKRRLHSRPATARNLSVALQTGDPGRSATFVYAGHSAPTDDGRLAVLRLSDRDLAASEWLTDDGRRRFPMPSGVVLVSCSSGGFGTPDWYGLATAALAAGAHTVVCSIWSHPDAATPLDAEIVRAVAAGGDSVSLITEVVRRWVIADTPVLGQPIRELPLVWANYAVVSVEPPPS